MSRRLPPIFASSGVFPASDPPTVLATAEAWGVRHVEMSSGLAPYPDPAFLLKSAAERGFTLLLHNYFPAPKTPFVLNLASGDPESLEASRTHCRLAMDLCAEIGCGLYSVHAGFAARLRPEHLGRKLPQEAVMPRAEALDIFRDSIEGLVRYGRERGVRLLVENNVCAPFNLQQEKNALLLLVEHDEMIRFAAGLSMTDFGYLVDVAHAFVSARTLGFDPVAFLHAVAPMTGALHLSANDGTVDSNAPFGPDAWFLPHLRLFETMPIVIEAYRLSRSDWRGCVAAVRWAYEDDPDD